MNFLDKLVARAFSQVETVRPQVVSVFEPLRARSAGAVFQKEISPEFSKTNEVRPMPSAECLEQARSVWSPEREREGLHDHDQRSGVEPAKVELNLSANPDGFGNKNEITEVGQIKTTGVAKNDPASIFIVPSKIPNRQPQPPRAEKISQFQTQPKDVVFPQVRTNPALSVAQTRRITEPRSEEQIQEVDSTSTTTRNTPLSQLRPNEVVIKAIPAEQAQLTKESKSERQIDAAKPRSTSRQNPIEDSSKRSHLLPAPLSFDITSPRLRSVPSREVDAKESSTVHITIGRVEVRAMNPPTANPKPRPSRSPAMSLGEYMRRRAGEERR